MATTSAPSPLPETFPFDVFLSYTHTDLDIATKLVELLGAHDVQVTWDQQFDYGALVPNAIDAAMRRARWVVVLLSRNSIGRPWVGAEIWATDKVLPILIEELPEDELPLQLRPKVRANIVGWDGNSLTPELSRLVDQLLRSRSTTPGNGLSVTVAPRGKKRKKNHFTTKVVVGFAAAVAVTGGVSSYLRGASGQSSRHPASGAGAPNPIRPAPSMATGRCNFIGRASRVELQGPGEGILTSRHAFSAPYAQVVRMPDAWLRYQASLKEVEEYGPGVTAEVPFALTPTSADDKPFDVTYEIRRQAGPANGAHLHVVINKGGQDGEISGGSIWAFGKPVKARSMADDPNAGMELYAKRPFEIDLQLATEDKWPEGKPLTIAGPFRAVTRVRLAQASGEFDCAPDVKGAVNSIWSDEVGRLYVDEIRIKGSSLELSIHSPVAPELQSL